MNESKSIIAPVAQKQRIISLDVIRGVAVLGILLMNIMGFAFLSENTARIDALLQATGSLDYWLNFIVSVLFEGKMRALFCMLFGAGIMLFIEQKRSKSGKTPWGLFYRRMLWLVLFGLVNAHILLWEGDILYFYGIYGMLVFLLRNLKPIYKSLGIVIVIIFSMVMAQNYYSERRSIIVDYRAVEKKMEDNIVLNSTDSLAIDKWEDMKATYFPDTEEVDRKIQKMRGSYGEVASVVRPKALRLETEYLPFILGDNVALMLLGMALLQWGFFRGSWTRKHYKRTMLIGLGIGIPIAAISTWHNYTNMSSLEAYFNYVENHPISIGTYAYDIQRLLITMGFVSFLMLIIRKDLGSWLQNSLRATGQMALTNYLLQSVLCAFIFYGFGLGYFEKLTLWQAYLVVLGVWVFEMILSTIWLRYFRFGPMEWVWRCLTYWQWIPLVRKST